MNPSKIILVAFVTILSVLSVTAQSPCQSATPMSNVNATQFTGVWYEEVRAPAKNISCVKITVDLVNNQTLRISTLYSASQSGLHMTQNDTATVSLSDVNANTGFNISYNNGGMATTYKIISTDYSTNAVLCGFTNASDPTTSMGLILTRQQIPNYSVLTQLQQNTSSILTNFNGNSAVNITQSNSCYINSAVTSASMLTPVFALVYALIKILY